MTVIPDIDKFVLDQLSVFPELASNYRSARNASTRQIVAGGVNITLQNNPDRKSSTTSDGKPLRADVCPLCSENMPKKQKSFEIEGRKHRKYNVRVNLFPIFPNHLVLCLNRHEPQSIWHHFSDMLDFSRILGYTVFYNGPHSGASQTGHLHFQACPRGYMALERIADRMLGSLASIQGEPKMRGGDEVPEIPQNLTKEIEFVSAVQDAQLFHYKRYTRGTFFLRARTSKSMAKLFYRLLDCAPFVSGESEPRFNVLTFFSEGEYRAVVFLRSKHHSSHYDATGEKHYCVAPGAADMGGCFILPESSDFERLSSEVAEEILSEVSIGEKEEAQVIWRLVRSQKRISVGIMSADEIRFDVVSDGAGVQKVFYREGKIDYNGALYDELQFEAKTISTLFAEPSFTLYDVTIGKQFHWEQHQDQVFAGTLKFVAHKGKVVAINQIGIEDYLLSVISSEMSADAPLELLKAHAVISRSWLMNTLRRAELAKSKPLEAASATSLPALVTMLDSSSSKEEHGGERISWQDHKDHHIFDVCADDHCQRYQGLGVVKGDNVHRAIDETWGQCLCFEGQPCDTRFSKCCGGMTELFSTCWEDNYYPYLRPVEDPYCSQASEEDLRQVLNAYDLSGGAGVTWHEEYEIGEISSIISNRLGVDIGRLAALQALERGESGRIWKLRLSGSKASITIGKELSIRRALSPTHLKSSAFTSVIKDGKLVLDGRGWGHGVGLCQVGAAVMALKGFSFEDILSHYYPGAELAEL